MSDERIMLLAVMSLPVLITLVMAGVEYSQHRRRCQVKLNFIKNMVDNMLDPKSPQNQARAKFAEMKNYIKRLAEQKKKEATTLNNHDQGLQ